MLRQDDAIASLMQDWNQQQGFQAPMDKTKTTEKTRDRGARKRKLPELTDYPNNSYLAGSHSIWNPYVQAVPFDDVEPSVDDVTSSVIPTNPQVEVVRRRAYEAFKKECLEVIQRIIQQPFKVKFSIPSVLEKWHMDAKHKERGKYEGINRQRYPLMATTAKINAWTRQDFEHYFDPILLSNQSSDLLGPLLREEVLRAWNQRQGSTTDDVPPKLQKKLNQVHRAIHKIIMHTREIYAKQLQQVANQAMLQAAKSRKQPRITRVEENTLIQITHAGNSFRIHPSYHEKLQRLYDRQQQRKPTSDDFTFEEALFCMLCRYDMLQGAGLQAGVPGSIMDTLLNKLDCRMECFASPLNCRYETFASAFDLDALFGSLSSFFHLSNLPSGCYQANPPFCDGVIGALSRKMELFLRDATDPLMFVVFVPAWKESKSYQQLLDHKYLSKHLLLDQGKHWYAEGTQHRRQDSFRVASFDTSVLFYQNDAAKESEPVDESVLEAITEAFCQDPGKMDKQSSPATPKSKTTKSTVQTKVTDDVDSSQMGIVEKKPSTRKGPKKTNRGKKRAFAGGEEENAAHLDVLKSLGLMSNEDGNDEEKVNETQKVVDFESNKKRKKKKKKKSKA
ncbi:unnamed protein product [Cylindrotheca closterium]|uniref:PCIF1 WW domain-containing protein n=1 Tax=Cylindrotheca closterium TaxID=2856 RepID=A0AAD2G886_9STRA|nr:unnamed protein product [Cylindrotheca closterium]